MTARQTFLNLPETKRRRITDVAVKEFAAQGYAGASINRMIDRLQIAKGSIFQYFGKVLHLSVVLLLVVFIVSDQAHQTS